MNALNDLADAGVLINGRWQRGCGEALHVINPCTGETITSLASTSEEQVQAAVAAAQAALPLWRDTPMAQRGQLLHRIAELVEEHKAPLTALQCLNNGKPASEAALDVADVASTFAYYAGLCAQGHGLQPLAVPVPDPDVQTELQQVAVGVVGLIVPWNFPMVTSAWKLAPALAAGCSVVLKPSELTPLAEIALARLIQQAGLPDGVFNLVPGAARVGRALVQHPGIAKISFTGSNATGQAILAQSAARLQRVSLELGGKSALVVLDDADLGTAVDLAVGGAFFNAGQMCSATSRVLVARPMYARFVEALVAAAQTLRHGDPLAASTTLGPLISRAAQQGVLARIDAGRNDGASLRCGGGTLTGAGGFALAPTVFTEVPLHSALWTEEIFGPVACVLPFDTDAQALALANQSDFGLVATLVSQDLQRAHALAHQLEVGTVWINTPQLIFPQTGWGGFKRSGLGRELGPWGLQAFLEIRHIVSRS